MSVWTPEMDRALLRVVEDNPSLTWPERASLMSVAAGQPITEDQIRNRHRRVVNAKATIQTLPVSGEIEVPAIPEGDYVGFDLAFFDIESTGLGGYGSEMTVACVVDHFGRAEMRDKFDFPQRNILDDRGLCIWLRDKLEEFDVLIGWYGTMFDVPYLNARLIMHGEKPMRDMMINDPCYKARGGRYGLRIGSSKLKVVAKALRTEHQKPDVEWDTFRLASFGDDDALAEVRERCQEDCYTMRDIWQRFKPMIRTIHK